MNGYLGEFPVDISKHEEFSKYTPADWAMYFVESYGQIDGSHHKQWVLDQVARCLKGTPIVVVEAKWDNGHTEYRISTSKETSQEYRDWVQSMLGEVDSETEETEYEYDQGIAP